MFVNLTFDMIFSNSPGLNRSPEEGPTARADLTAVVTVLARPLAANLKKKTRVMRKYTSTATRVMRKYVETGDEKCSLHSVTSQIR